MPLLADQMAGTSSSVDDELFCNVPMAPPRKKPTSPSRYMFATRSTRSSPSVCLTWYDVPTTEPSQRPCASRHEPVAPVARPLALGVVELGDQRAAPLMPHNERPPRDDLSRARATVTPPRSPERALDVHEPERT